ncbi:hypothetical protein K4K52_002869 [Colletotrichum sp. SAR 10_76]|nr:hypothetical protein K4K52_002869 [Colletotrichum sp. SAR 10_76]
MDTLEEDTYLPPGSARLLSEESVLVLIPEPTADPNDPLNWTLARKYVNTLFVLAVTVAVFAAMTMQMVFWQQMTVELGMTYDELNAGVSFNVVGLALGCLCIIPFTKKYGRRSTYIFSTAVMAATSWWSSRMRTVPEMYITNLLFGLAGSTNETIAEMTSLCWQIADLFFVHQRGLANGFYITSVMIGNFLAPTLAGIQAASMGWRWAYYTVGICLTILFLLFLFFFEETKYVPVSVGVSTVGDPDLQETQNKLRKAKSNATASPPAKDKQLFEKRGDQDVEQIMPPVPLPNKYRQRMRFSTPTEEPLLSTYIAPFKMALFPHVVFSAIQCANAVAFLVLLTSINSIVFAAPPYNFSTAGVGLMLIGPFIGNMIGSIYGGIFGDRIVVRLARKNRGIFEPEMRLHVLFVPALLMGVGVVIFGITADRGMHWVYPSIGGALFAFGMSSMMDVSFTIVIDTYKAATAESFVFITFVRNAATIGVPAKIISRTTTSRMPITKVDVKPAHEQEQLNAISWQELVDEKKQQLTGAIPAKWKLDVSLVKELTEANGGRLLELDPARRSGVLDDVELDITESNSAVELVNKMALGRLTATQVVTAFCKRAAVAQQLASCLTESFYDEAIARAKFLDDYYRKNGKTIGPLHGLPISLKDTFKVVGFDATAGYVNGLKLGPATTNSCLVSVLLDAGAVLYVKTNVPQTLMSEGVILSLPGPFPSAGPIASTMEDLQLFMSAVINQRPGACDATALDLPWRKPAVGQSLRLGVLEDDPAWPLHPPVRRAFEDAVNALCVAGHEVVRLPYDYERSVDLGLRLSYQFFELAHPPEEDLEAVLGEPLVKAAAARMHPFTAKPRPVPKDLAKPWHHLDDLDAARANFAETWHRTWFDHKLDAIVAPGADKTAVPHDTYGLMPYTVVFNILDTLDPEPVKAQDPFLPDYDPRAVDGTPCGIQVVTLKLKDEECLAAAAVVDKVVNADRQK